MLYCRIRLSLHIFISKLAPSVNIKGAHCGLGGGGSGGGRGGVRDGEPSSDGGGAQQLQQWPRLGHYQA